MICSSRGRAGWLGHLSTSENQRVLAAISATLLGKSLDMSSEVYLAMESRGFRGSIITLKPFKMRSKDWLWLLGFPGNRASSLLLLDDKGKLLIE